MKKDLYKAFLTAIFSDGGDPQPRRSLWFKFGTLEADDWNPADVVSETAAHPMWMRGAPTPDT